MNEPIWATELLQQVCIDEGRSKKPKIKWRNYKTRPSTGGLYNPKKNRITIIAGTKGNDHKQVFLHEVCHWLTRPRGWRIVYNRRNWHGKRFYKKLHDLLIRYDCLTTEYQEREANYKKRSVNYL